MFFVPNLLNYKVAQTIITKLRISTLSYTCEKNYRVKLCKILLKRDYHLIQWIKMVLAFIYRGV